MSVTAALYVVATPIGNLDDISARALKVLAEVDLIAAEDTRHSAKLLHHYGISTATISLHEHNERAQVPRLIETLRAGKSIALISDAGTPLLSDPGFHLVRAARAAGVRVIPLPGASAAITALSVAGLPTDRFVFEGFTPARAAARRGAFEAVRGETRTIIYYESSHRLLDSLADMIEVFGADRLAVLARELTKKFETVIDGPLAELRERITRDANEQLGEFVILLHGAPVPAEAPLGAEVDHTLRVLLETMSLKEAVAVATRLTGIHKNALYERALVLKRDSAGDPSE